MTVYGLSHSSHIILTVCILVEQTTNNAIMRIITSLLILTALLHTDPVMAQSATYYHPSLAGRKMANGKPYNPNAMIAASNSYRLGQRVKVTNRRTGKSVIVTITDRCGNCSIDLSSAAFSRIAKKSQGRVSVKVTKL